MQLTVEQCDQQIAEIQQQIPQLQSRLQQLVGYRQALTEIDEISESGQDPKEEPGSDDTAS